MHDLNALVRVEALRRAARAGFLVLDEAPANGTVADVDGQILRINPKVPLHILAEAVDLLLDGAGDRRTFQP